MTATTADDRDRPTVASVLDALRSERRPVQLGRLLAEIAVFLVVVEAVFHLSLTYLIDGIALGSLYGIIGVALILVYRTNRIINFAAAALGAVPAIAGLLLDVQKHVNYLVALPLALIGGPLVGALVDIVIVRRFARSPRLILTVVTIGIAQGLAALGFFIPVWMGVRAGEIPNVPTPWEKWKILNGRGQPLLTGNQVAALVTVIVLATALSLFLRYTRIGIAMRASAENSDRASLLGIPVRRVGTIAWALAGLLSAMAVYVQSPLIGVPSDATLGFTTLLYGLAAAVIARMERMGVSMLAGMGVGILVFASVAKYGDNNLASALMLVVILGALIVQRQSFARALDAGTSTWDTVKNFRPVPTELRSLREVGVARSTLVVVSLAVAIVPAFLIRQAELPSLTVLPLFGMVAVSLVILTGWAGQISLGQFGLVGAGAAVAGGLVAKHNIDFFAAMAIGIAVGAAVAVVIGLPAVRIQGLYLAVTTLAFGYAMQSFFLNTHYWIGKHVLPGGYTADIRRPLLYGRINLENDRTFYFTCLAFLAVAMVMAMAFRRTRSGRVLIAARDNQRAAPAYSINLVRTRLAAFAISGGIAGMAGVLYAYAQHNVIKDNYNVESSIVIFLAAVIGGLTSVPWAVIGAVSLEWFTLFGPHFYRFLGPHVTAVVPLLLTGPLLVVNLYFYPGGSAEAGFQQRDTWLRKLAARHDILVPSLVADRRVDDDTGAAPEEESAIVRAEHELEEVDELEAATTGGRP